MRAFATIIAVALLSFGAESAPPLAVAASARPPSLCAEVEEVVFGCRQGGKTVSLCAAPIARSSKQTQLRYVFGSPQKIELEIDQSSHPSAFTSGVSGLAGGGIDFVRVENGDYSYVVYTGETPGWAQDGWIVEQHGTAVSHHICKRVATGQQVWAPVYAAKLSSSRDNVTFAPPDWVGASPPHHGR